MSTNDRCPCAGVTSGTHKSGVLRKILDESGFPPQIIDFMTSQIKFDPSEIMATPNAERVC